jgi:hypothetical protein
MSLSLPDCKLTFVCGPVASGKTHLIRTWLAKDNHHVIFDGTGEFLDDDREQIWANPRLLYDRIKENPYCYRIVYQPGIRREEDFGHVLKAMWWIDQPKLLVCDEWHEMCSVGGVTPEVEMLLRFARHDKMGFVGASQRIADVNKLYTSACRLNVLFQTNEARDLDAINERWRCADMVMALRPLLIDDVSGVTKQIPQAVVIEKGHSPYVYDFATESVVNGEEDSDEPKADSGGSPLQSLGDDEGTNSGEEQAGGEEIADPANSEPAGNGV